MNQYTEVLIYLKQLAENDSFVNTVKQGEISELDINKTNIYPLVNIAITGANFSNGQTVSFNLDIRCLAQRDINKEVVIDKFWKNDNEVDNLNETLAVLNRMWTTIYRDFDDNNISVTSDPSLEPLIYDEKNILDGWALTTTIELPNTTLNLCQSN
jgi:hypothetical protein